MTVTRRSISSSKAGVAADLGSEPVEGVVAEDLPPRPLPDRDRRPGRSSRTSSASGTVRSSRSRSAVPRKPVVPVMAMRLPASPSRITPSVYHLVSEHERASARRRADVVRHPGLRGDFARRHRRRAGRAQADDPLLLPEQGRPARRASSTPVPTSSRPSSSARWGGRATAGPGSRRWCARCSASPPAGPRCSGSCGRCRGSGRRASTRLAARLDPLVKRAQGFLEEEMAAGRLRRAIRRSCSWPPTRW